MVDDRHPHHERVHRWIETQPSLIWATCPLTENGFIRIVSSVAYSARHLTVVGATESLNGLCRNWRQHSFWPIDLSLTDASVFRSELIVSPKQLTDVCLLALAVKHDGILVTLDRRINFSAVVDATPAHLLVP